MSTGLDTTFDFLAKTENRAAVDILIAALDSEEAPIQTRALRASMMRRNPKTHQAVFQRLSQLGEDCRAIIDERPDRLVAVASAMMKNRDPQVFLATCQGIISFGLYDTVPALIGAVVDPENPDTDVAARTVLKLTQEFYAELCGGEDQTSNKDLDTLRRRLTSSLEDGTRKFFKHERPEIVEAFLLVAKPQNATLRQILQTPDDRAHDPILEQLSTSEQGGVVRLLLGFLEDSQMPRAVLNVLSKRSDAKFVENLLRKIGARPPRAVLETLKRIKSFAWLEPGHEVFTLLDDEGQSVAINTMLRTSMDRDAMLETIRHTLSEGKPGGRRAAARALADFHGAEADALTVRSLGDEDPEVRAHVVRQLRPRRIPGAFSLMIRMVDNPPEPVRLALKDAMPEFNLRQFLMNFETLDEVSQPLAGQLVRRIDVEALPLVHEEMRCLSPVRRRRAALAAGAMGLAEELEQQLVTMLSDEDHIVRVAAARVLSECKTMLSWEALRDAIFDRSVIVKEAAEQSLMRISESLVRAPETEQDGEENAESTPDEQAREEEIKQ